MLDRILETKKLNVGVPHYPPLADFRGKEGNMHVFGLYCDMINLIAQKHGFTITFSPYRLSTCVDEIVAGHFDIVTSVFKTIDRAMRADFTAALHMVNVTAVTRTEDLRVQSPADLHNKEIRIVVTKGEIGQEILRDYIEIEDLEERLIEVDTDTISEIVTLVATGAVDVAVADSLSCHNYLKTCEDSTLRNVFRYRPLYVCPNATMLPKGQAHLRDWLNHEFREIRKESSIAQKESKIAQEFKGIVERVG